MLMTSIALQAASDARTVSTGPKPPSGGSSYANVRPLPVSTPKCIPVVRVSSAVLILDMGSASWGADGGRGDSLVRVAGVAGVAGVTTVWAGPFGRLARGP